MLLFEVIGGSTSDSSPLPFLTGSACWLQEDFRGETHRFCVGRFQVAPASSLLIGCGGCHGNVESDRLGPIVADHNSQGPRLHCVEAKELKMEKPAN